MTIKKNCFMYNLKNVPNTVTYTNVYMLIKRHEEKILMIVMTRKFTFYFYQ